MVIIILEPCQQIKSINITDNKLTIILSGSPAFIVKVSLRAIPELMMSFLIRRYCIVYCVGSWFLYSAHPCQDLTVKIYLYKDIIDIPTYKGHLCEVCETMSYSQNSLLGFGTRNSARLFNPISNNFPNVSPDA